MSSLDVLVIILMTLLLMFCPIILLHEIALESEDIPTIMNGLVSSISIMIGFTATILTLKMRREDLKLTGWGIALFLFVVPMLLLFLTYILLIWEDNPQPALRCAMLDLIISFAIFVLTIHVVSR